MSTVAVVGGQSLQCSRSGALEIGKSWNWRTCLSAIIAQRSNYAINPTPEQALRSNRAVLPARVIAALDLAMDPNVFESLILLPMFGLWAIVTCIIAVGMKHRGDFRADKMSRWGALVAGVMAGALCLYNLMGYGELVSRGEVLVLEGNVQIKGYFAAAQVALIGGALGGLLVLGMFMLGRAINNVSEGKI